MLDKFPTVRRFMDSTQNTLRPGQTIREAVRFLLDEGMTSAPVLDDAGQLVGILSEKECLKLLTQGEEVQAATVADLMVREVVTVPPEMDIYFAAGIFLRNAFRRLPVIENGRLVGQLTRRDTLRAIELNLHHIETPWPRRAGGLA